MKRRWLLGLAAALALALVSTGRAASPLGATVPSNPTLALAALDKTIAELDSTVQADKIDIERVGTELGGQHARLLSRGKGFYKLTRAGLLPVGGGFDALVTYAMRVERARRLLTSELDAEIRLRARAVDLASEIDRLARDRLSLASQRAAMDATRLALLDDARRQSAFDKAFETSTGAGADYVSVYGGVGGVATDAPAGGFAAARGRLLFPVAGRADVRPAHRDGTDGPGLEIHAPAGSVVRAAFAGHVAFADRYGPYGRIVILDHGGHFYTVSGNLDEIDVKIGQDVGAGERIGTVGDDGQGPMLYFEVRHGSQTVPPSPWLGL
jgi:murein DD-endopeptidase MepM/ murein hydrolase activator NlpD